MIQETRIYDHLKDDYRQSVKAYFHDFPPDIEGQIVYLKKHGYPVHKATRSRMARGIQHGKFLSFRAGCLFINEQSKQGNIPIHPTLYFLHVCQSLLSIREEIFSVTDSEQLTDAKRLTNNMIDLAVVHIPIHPDKSFSSKKFNPDQVIRRIYRLMRCEMVLEALYLRDNDNENLYNSILEVAKRFVYIRSSIEEKKSPSKQRARKVLKELSVLVDEGDLVGFYRRLNQSGRRFSNQFLPFEVDALKDFYSRRLEEPEPTYTRLTHYVIDRTLRHAKMTKDDISSLANVITRVTGLSKEKVMFSLRNILLSGFPLN